jgi:hypothetical protein
MVPDVIRKPLGAILIIVALAAYAALVGLASGWIAQLPILAQTMIYLVLGIAWVPALMPLTRWTETGHLRKPKAISPPPGG